MMKLCAERGDGIVVGFLGGLSKLRAMNFAELQAKRAFKWDDTAAGIGNKISTNWIAGSVFMAEVKAKEQAG